MATSIPDIANASNAGIGTNHKTNIKLGIASYSLRKFSLEEALDMTLRCGLNRINLKSMHLPLDSKKETIRKAVLLCKKKEVVLYDGGAIHNHGTGDKLYPSAESAYMTI